MKGTNDSKSTQYCPICDEGIFAKDMNISQGVALCGSCGTLSQLSELNYSGATTEETLSQVPNGIRLIPGSDSLEIQISLFSIPEFLGSLFVTLFWNGIVSIFLSLAAAAIYYNLFGPCPDWFPTPGLKDGKPIMNDQVMGPGMTIFICLFLTPFVVIGTGMAINTLLRLFGTTKIVIHPYRSYVATGISFISVNRFFDPSNVKSIDINLSNSNRNGQDTYVIELESTKTIKFGRMLSEKQLYWVRTLLKQVFFQRHSTKFGHLIPNMFWLNSHQQ